MIRCLPNIATIYLYRYKCANYKNSAFLIYFSGWKRPLCIYFLILTLFNFQADGNITLSSNEATGAAERDYNLLIGELRLNLGVGSRFQWDSNVNRSSSDELTAFSMIPTLFLDVYWPLNPYLQLFTGTSFGYEIFLEGESNNPARNGLIIGGINENAASQFDLDVNLGNNKIITASNAFSANIATVSVQNDARQRQDKPFRRFTNVSSLRFAQRLTPQTRVSLSYNFSDTFTKDAIDENDETINQAVGNSLDQQTQTISGEISSQANDSLILSLQGNVSSTEYSEKFRNDSRNYRISPQVIYVSNSGFTSSVYIALDQLDFDTTSDSEEQDNQSTQLTIQSSVSFVQSNLVSHTFGFSYGQNTSNATTFNPANPGETIPVNFETNTDFAYNLNYPLSEQLNIDLSYKFTKTEESNGGNQYYRETASVALPLQLTERASISARYRYLRTFGSEFQNFNNDQQIVEMSFQLNI